MFSLVSESRLCFQTGVKREKNGGKRKIKGCWEIAEGEYAWIERGKKWTWRQMARDSCKDEGRVGKKAEDEREERNMLLPLSFMSRLHITRRVLLQLWHKTWLCYKASHRHYELRRQLNCALPSLLLLSSSHPQPPYYSSQWECRPSALSLDLQPPPPGDIHPPIFHSSSSYKVDSPWPLWTDTHVFTSVCLRK